MLRVPKLESVLKYKNQEVVARFRKEFGVSKRHADVIFEDMLRFIWLSVKAEVLNQRGSRQAPPSVDMLDQMLIIDEMWHTFVLYTVDYTNFSHRYFGEFIHHVPTPTLPVKAGSNHEEPGAVPEDSLERQVEFVITHLGERVAKRWFLEFPKKYPEKKLQKMRFDAVL